ncbi:hypothetical protein ACSBR1_006260 [Camellia fascicularis]
MYRLFSLYTCSKTKIREAVAINNRGGGGEAIVVPQPAKLSQLSIPANDIRVGLKVYRRLFELLCRSSF